MKKHLYIFLISCLLVFSVSAQKNRNARGQLSEPKGRPPIKDNTGKLSILSALGIAGGITYGKQVWNPEGPLAQERWLFGFNGAILAEFFHHPVYRWRTELQYNQLGTAELLYQPAGVRVINRTNYISFNNYLKILFRPTGFVPYFLIGPRLEYLLNESAGVYPDILSQFYKLHVTGSIGLGAEMMWDSPIRPFIEVQYNHDLMVSYHYSGGPDNSNFFPTDMIYRGYELRLGVKYFFNGIKKDVCPDVYNPAGN